MTFDAHRNFAWGLVLTPPSPVTTGTSVTLQTGFGADMPSPPFNATVWPAGQQPVPLNAEIVRVTGVSGDVLTILRGQEGSNARSILPGDQFSAGITAKTLTDVETAFDLSGAASSAVSAHVAASDPHGDRAYADSNKLAKASNLSDLASTSSARTNLGLGSAATQASSAFDAAGAASTAQAAAIAASAQGLTPTAVKTSAYTAAAGDFVPVDASGGTVAIALPSAPADKTRIGIKIVAQAATPNTVTINRGGSDVFNKAGGSTALTLAALFQSVILQYASATGIWYAQSTDAPLNTASGAAKLGTDGTVGGPSGSALTGAAVLDSRVTTKGDLLGTNATPALTRLGVGSDGQVLTADAASTLGIKWAAAPGSGSGLLMDSGAAPTVDHVTALVDKAAWVYDQASGKVKGQAMLALPGAAAAGDLFYYDGSVLQRIPKGSNGQVLQSNGSVPSWQTPAAGGGGGGDPSQAPSTWGFLAHSFSIYVMWGGAGTANLRFVTQRVQLMRVEIPSTISVTNIILDVNQIVVTPTSGQNLAGIYNSSGTLLGQTADQSAVWTSATEPTIMPISGGPISVASGFVWVAVLSNAATPVGVRGMFTSNSQTVLNMGLTAATFKVAAGPTGQTSLPSTITPGSNTASNVPFWCALS